MADRWQRKRQNFQYQTIQTFRFFFSPKEKKNNVLTTNYSGRMETHQIWFENVVKYRWNFDNSIDGILPISC